MRIETEDLIKLIETEYQDEIIDFFKEIIEIESPTTDREAVNQVGELIRRKVNSLGAEIEIEPSGAEDRGDHIIARWPGEDNTLKPILVIAHMDTVWKKGTLADMPFKVEDNKIYGPGIFDMKGAVVFAIEAMKIIQDLNKKTKRPITFLFNSDEEINSTTSRSVINREALKSEYVLILEGGVGEAVLTARKGILYFKVTAKGKASHAGMDHEKGINAIEEISNQVIKIQRLTDYKVGTTVSCGVISGGTRTNVIPAKAVLEIDARVPTNAESERLIKEIESLTPVLEGAELDIYTLVKRPPLDRTDGIVDLYSKAKQFARELGYELEETSTGAISDGNLTAALGIPTLDGLGPIGDGAHAVYEHIEKDKIAKRLALLVKLLEKL
ncbi:M20 family metallopeptidase [Schinkia azotoformans]|uniref:Peptidase dimerization domain-containing protein n=1 Tax=Schinkia azotoformans LMG 9581 TaxID=1131731 RepID=K6DRP8_SCHAZ|nr:M20 family metallopeptidase [Schinkia azotoformans]EKN63456.1 peptidase dimerization domain-containing protein [Schinkia azotoformans LMG 9581]MEC1638755.1 M20 family metallopeptidase [Schinkia azotoformans]MEC1946720.1 M20 family metallopeptidase [Schinkia azotoformans]